MNRVLLLKYQRALIYAALDEITGDSLLDSKDYSKLQLDQSWLDRLKVANFFYRNISCDLVRLEKVAGNIVLDGAAESVGEIFLNTSLNKDDVFSLSLWHAVFFGGTKDLSQLLGRHGLLDWGSFGYELVPSFAEELIQLYKKKEFDLSDIL